MATIDSQLVEAEIKRMIAVSRAVKSQIREAFEQLERDPAVYDELDFVDELVAEEFSDVVLRKIYITTQRHNFRIIFAHWTSLEHVDLLLAFPRKAGYAIDWDWVRKTLTDRDPT